MDEQLDKVRAVLEGYIVMLYQQAKDTEDRYMQFLIDSNKGRLWKEKNNLAYRVRQKNNTLMLEWYQIGGKTVARTERESELHYIRKRNKNKRGTDKVYGYEPRDILKYVPDRDHERVLEVEAEAKTFRRQAHYCASMLVILGRLTRYLTELDGEQVAGDAA